jgi:hypothetical protein
LESRLFVVYLAQMPNKKAKYRKQAKKKANQAVKAYKRAKKRKK